MLNMRAKLIGAGAVLVVAATLLAIGGLREGWVYFLPVDEYLQSPDRWTQRVRLHGTVGDRDFHADRAMLTAEFDLVGSGGGDLLRVRYAGVVPEMLDVGRDVVVEGTRDASGAFVADSLMTKCSSKYESADGEAPHADPHRAEPSG